jgi:hypothetical protein
MPSSNSTSALARRVTRQSDDPARQRDQSLSILFAQKAASNHVVMRIQAT